jgi:hypothetical protein
MRKINAQQAADTAARYVEAASPDEVDDGGPAAAAAAVGEGSVHEQRVVEGRVTCSEGNGDGGGKRGALGWSKRLRDGVHVAGKTGYGQDVGGLAVALAPRVAAWYVLQKGICCLRS